jgi:BirA family biotin operon repressor/biotin-[acetyl-CoA-carboxylase] ligase
MRINWSIDVHPVLGSTQDVLKACALDGKSEGVVVQALEQTTGRGRHGRCWNGARGNLCLSILLRPNCDAFRIGELSFFPAVALTNAIKDFCFDGGGISLKWPNDVLLHGKKCAGILIESGLSDDGLRVEWVALGVGVNICCSPIETGDYIQNYCDDKISLDDFRDRFLLHMSDLYDLWQVQGFALIRDMWLRYGHRKGDGILVKPWGKAVQGVFEDLDAHGNLILCTEDGGVRKIISGDVYLV